VRTIYLSTVLLVPEHWCK